MVDMKSVIKANNLAELENYGTPKRASYPTKNREDKTALSGFAGGNEQTLDNRDHDRDDSHVPGN